MPAQKSHRKTRQKLGQHFLAQTSWRKRIAETLGGTADAVWVEIGTGHGEMTELLAARTRRVIAIETDAALIGPLRERAAHWLHGSRGSGGSGLSRVEIVHGDVLSLDLAALVRSHPANDLRQGTVSTVPKSAITTGVLTPEAGLETGKPAHQVSSGERFRVYGNLPYYITSPILSHLFRFASQIDSIHIVTQLEVAERIAARPRSRDYGYLSTLCQFYAQPELVFRIPPGAFHPPPKVTSALIAMRFPGERAALGIRDESAFLKFLQLCFAHKRKTLRNNLRSVHPQDRIERALGENALADNSRAEELTLQQFARIFLSLNTE